jgi:23S rRNA (guanosine2251-2'-O)-methyltransferase
MLPAMSNRKDKSRANSKTYWLYGIHAVSAALSNPDRRLKRILLAPAAAEKIRPLLAAHHPRPEQADAQQIARLASEQAVHQGVAAEAVPLEPPSLEECLAALPAKKPFLLLDQVTDPHNVGAILRSAAAFDAAAVVLTKDHAPEESAALAKAASGALEILPLITVTNLTQAMETLKKAGYWCVGLEGEAKQELGQAKLDAATALVLGAEGRGLRRLTAERCDLRLRLPISARMESLNVSNAAAVALYELHRRRPA